MVIFAEAPERDDARMGQNPAYPAGRNRHRSAYSAADLRQRWRALMGPLGFGERLLWFGFMGPTVAYQGAL